MIHLQSGQEQPTRESGRSKWSSTPAPAREKSFRQTKQSDRAVDAEFARTGMAYFLSSKEKREKIEKSFSIAALRVRACSCVFVRVRACSRVFSRIRVSRICVRK